MFKKITFILAIAFGFGVSASAQEKHEAPILKLVESQMMAWAQSSIVVEAIKAQNNKHAAFVQADIDKLDKQWMEETKGGSKPLIESILVNPLSVYLKKIKADSKGLYAEIFVMDNKGLNVGQSDITSDYWQADEAKWQKTFSVGPKAIFIDKVRKDESSQALTSQVSFAIVDPATNAPIGAITVGVNVEELAN